MSSANWAGRSASAATRRWWLEVVLFAIVVAIAFVTRLQLIATGMPAFLTPDSDDYILPAYELAHGASFQPELRRTPLYALVLAAVIRADGDLRTIVTVQHWIGVGTVIATYVLGRSCFGPLAGAIAGAAVALSGPQLIYEHFVMSETLFGFIITVTAVGIVCALRWPRWRTLVAAGVLAGLAALTRPVGQILIAVAASAALTRGGSARARASRLTLVLAGAALVLIPWFTRTWMIHGTSGAEGALGQALIGRTVRHDRGFVYDDPLRPDPDPTRTAARRIIQEEAANEPSGGTITQRVRDELGLSQAATGALLRDLAIDVIRAQPGYYIRGSLSMAWELLQGHNERLLGNWRQRVTRNWDKKWDPRLAELLDPETAPEGDAYDRADAITSRFQPWRSRLVLSWLTLLGVVYAVAFSRWRSALVPFAIAAATVAAAAGLDGPVARFRYPVDPCIFVVAAGAISATMSLTLAAARRTVRSGRLAGGDI